MSPTGNKSLVAAGAAALFVLLAGCSSGAGMTASDSSAAAPERAAAGLAKGGVASSVAPVAGPGAKSVPIEARAVISTGRVTLVGRDLTHVRSEIDRLLARYGGYVSQEQTTNDRSGRPRDSSLQLRVPSTAFDTVMNTFHDFARVRESHRQTQDVTTQVIDVNARVLTDRDSIATLRGFLRHTHKVDDLIQLESDISEREADLESLLAQQRYLDNATTLATIDAYLTVPAHTPPVHKHHDSGFLAGLGNGWDALAAASVVVLTVVGAMLPFALLVALVGVPAWLLVRRTTRRHQTEPAPTAPEA
jgi:hypothetical protein